jgi:hypothetical protein
LYALEIQKAKNNTGAWIVTRHKTGPGFFPHYSSDFLKNPIAEKRVFTFLAINGMLYAMKKMNIFPSLFQASFLPFSRDTFKRGVCTRKHEGYRLNAGFKFNLLSRFVFEQGEKYNQAYAPSPYAVV